MALTNVSGSNGTKQPSAPAFPVEVTADLDASYPSGGYDLSAVDGFVGATLVWSPPVPHFDGTATTRWVQLVDDAGTPKLKVYADASGAPGGEVSAATDLSNHTGVTVGGMAQ